MDNIFSQAKTIFLKKKELESGQKRSFSLALNNCSQQFLLHENINLETALGIEGDKERRKPASHYDMDKQCGQVIQKSMKSYAWTSVTFLKRQMK